MPLNVYLDKCLYSPFDFPEYRKKFESKNIKLVRHARAARVIMSSYLPVLKKYLKLKGKHFLLWSHEPYHDYTQKNKLVVDGITVHIMNVYTKDVFTHNLRYFYFKTELKELVIDEDDAHTRIVLRDETGPRGPKIVALSTYYDHSYYGKNPKSTLTQRYDIILCGYSLSYVDVYGKGWDKYPNVTTQGNSRNDKDRRKSKGEILENYWFNICLENASAPHYVTEKIWEAIKYGCLPIYYANETIYQTFPKDSFIDYKVFEEYGIEEFYRYLELMTVKEYKERMNMCIRTFNKIIKNGQHTTWRGKSGNANINYLEYETCYQTLLKKLTKF